MITPDPEKNPFSMSPNLHGMKFIMNNSVLIVFLIGLLFVGCSLEMMNNQRNYLHAPHIAFDSHHNLIVYNGENKNISMKIEGDILEVGTEDGSFIIGKQYDVRFQDKDYQFYYTELPIIVIETEHEIPDEPKVKATMTLYERNNPPFTSLIGIEVRGGHTSLFSKKSYGVELRRNNYFEITRDASLLGLRNDDDWILNAMQAEPLRIRDFTAHSIWLQMGQAQYEHEAISIGINRRYCEVFINGVYRGVYYLSERIDRKQLGLEKYDGQARGELYKGAGAEDSVLYRTLLDYDNDSSYWGGHEWKYPDIIDWRPLHTFTDFVINSSQSDFNHQIASKLDMENAIDFFIFINVLQAWDNTGKNTYLAKYDSSSPYFYIPWDLDATIGNSWRGDGSKTYDEGGQVMLGNSLFSKLLMNPDFIHSLKARWQDLSVGIFELENFKQMFRENYIFLRDNGIYQRESRVPQVANNYGESLVVMDNGEGEMNYIEQTLERIHTTFNTFIEGL